MEVLQLSEWIAFFPEIKVWDASDALISSKKGSVPHFVAALITGMSWAEENSFFDRICCPHAIRRQAVDIKHFGDDGSPLCWVQGRDLFHVFEPGPAMGRAVQWCFIGQINGLFASKEEAVAWIEQHSEDV